MIKKIILYIIQTIEKFEYRKLKLDETDYNKKILNTIYPSNLLILSDSGYVPITDLHITQPYTIWHIQTSGNKILDCANTHILFDENFNEIFVDELSIGDSIQTINGIEFITSINKTMSKVSLFDLTVNHHDHRYYSNGILSHQTITSGVFLSWFLLFHFDKNVLLMSNKGATTKEILDKIKMIFEGLPFFLKPGVIKKDVMTMSFDNRCRIIGQNTTKTGGIGFTIHLLYLDEFAHIQENIKRQFYGNVYPTLSSSKISRIIITSTPNGYELFQELYQAAVDGLNAYNPTRVDWWEVPGRDEEWKAKEIANLGSEEEFNKQYACQFLSASSLLLSSKDILKLDKSTESFEFRDIEELEDISLDYSFLKWSPTFDLTEIENEHNFFLFSIDIAEGMGKDYSIINIFKIIPLSDADMNEMLSPSSIADFFTLDQVGIFRCNLHSIENFSKIIYTLCVKVFNQENLRVIVEYNTYGSEVIKNMITLYPSSNDFDEEILVRYKHRVGSDITRPGLKLQKNSKLLLCEKVKRAISDGRLIIKEKETVNEAKMFSRNENGTFSAQSGHDDAFMTVVNASSFFDTVDFMEIVEEYFDFIDDAKQKAIDGLLDASADDDSNFYDMF